jgi:hypothetical protein
MDLEELNRRAATVEENATPEGIEANEHRAILIERKL